MKKIIVIVLLFLSMSALADTYAKSKTTYAQPDYSSDSKAEHSGGTDSMGCHIDHRTGNYHCH